MARPRTDLKVQIIATRHEDEGADFHIKWKDDRGNWHSGPIVLPRDSGEYDVEFKLDDRSGLELNFEPAGADAIWINEGSCPELAETCDDKRQIENKRVDVRNKKLKLRNLNVGEPCNLHYMLRFRGDRWTNSEGKSFGPSYCKDPEFRNGGGRI